MAKIRILHILLLAFVVGGCRKIEPESPSGANNACDSDAILFGTEAIWTKGANIDDIADIDKLNVYSYWVENGVDWADATKEQLKSYFTSDINTPFQLTVADDGACTHDGGPRYWPAVAGVQLSFMTLYPEGQLTRTVDDATGKPLFSYAQSEYASENNDVLFATSLDKTVNDVTDGVVNLNLKHILSKLTIEAKYEGTCADDASFTNVKYEVEGVTISNLRGEANLVINADGSTEWAIDETKDAISVEAANGYTMLPLDDAETPENEADSRAKLTTSFKSVMADGKAIFVLPQDLASNCSGDAPAIQLRIRKTFDSEVLGETVTTRVIYQSSEIEIPGAMTTDPSWVDGKHYALQFSFDLSKLDEYDTPLSLRSEIYDWTPAEVDVDINPCMYIYASDSNIIAEKGDTYADFSIYTNCLYDLRCYSRKYELDGVTSTEAKGFTYYNVTNTPDNPNPDIWEETGSIKPLLLWNGRDDFNLGSDYDVSKLTAYTTGFDGKTQYVTSDGGVTKFEVPLDADGYPDVSAFEDSEGWIYFVLRPYATASTYDFYYKVKRSTRDEEGLYTNTSVGDDYSYGINKKGSDAVYTIRLSINPAHLNPDATGEYGYFFGKIGAEALSDAGGLFTAKFRVSLKMPV